VSIDPDSIAISDDAICGVMSVHRQGEVEDHGFTVRHDFGGGATWESSWPHEEFAILDRAGNRIQGGVCALLGGLADVWPQGATLHEILYVGQAYGTDGERTAWDRLQSHETLQRTLGEQAPDTQVWLTMATICDVQIVQEISPQPGRLPDEIDNEHIQAVFKKVYSEGFQDREAVALAEAGLIRGWQPEYNDRLKYNFPARKQVPLETARDLDLHGLIVEWQSLDLPPRYFCGDQGPAQMFFFGYEVHLEKDRAESLSLHTLRAPLLGGVGGGLPNAILDNAPDA
jgi:hypothetical protein